MNGLIRFRLKGRFAHFLRAEGGVASLSYPVPPRTVIMGLVGAVLGLGKDEPQLVLRDMGVTVEGKLPVTHWHKAKLRKDPPGTLNATILKKHSAKEGKPEKATFTRQEWLFNPEYVVGTALAEPLLSELTNRLRDRRWYFTPCLGLSELLADIEYLETVAVAKLPQGRYRLQGVLRQDQVTIDLADMYEKGFSLRMLRMPRDVSQERVFTQAPYLYETNNSAVLGETAEAFGDERGERAWVYL